MRAAAALVSRTGRIMEANWPFLGVTGLSIAQFGAAREASAAGDRIGQQADRKRVIIGTIIVEDRPVIVAQQEAGSIRPVWLDQRGKLILGEPGVAGRNDAEGSPFG